ncbi:FAD-dependent oxidoreductase [Mycobacteroides abscessus]|uniref:FAD-dependent oxidoreductase n=1 Tax=Mycobacteroides abscessus TaxID=36809 RepID=UPI000C261F95|nr:FAD-dependent oxidoreductase [Mycobacteroides abscessus]
MECHDESGCRRRAGEVLRSAGGKPFDIVEQDWTAEEFTRGCYGGRLGAGVWTQYGRALAAPAGRIHWAGAEVSHVWNGYMEGAILSGRQAAEEVLGALSNT